MDFQPACASPENTECDKSPGEKRRSQVALARSLVTNTRVDWTQFTTPDRLAHIRLLGEGA